LDKTLEDHLQALFGYREFRHSQKEIVTSILDGKDVLAILPTGAGKSICYQLPAMLMPGIAIVISPLISLMQDQVATLFNKGIPAALLNSSLHYQDVRSIINNLQDYKILYIAPERFNDQNFLQNLQNTPVSFFAIDEAHCISQWGHSFRPEYRHLSLLREKFPKSAIIALTATATRDVEKDISKQLAMRTPHVVKASFDRPNLTLHIKLKTYPLKQLSEFIEKRPNVSGIVYAATRKTVDETYEGLQKLGLKVGKYHAGMSDEERGTSQHNFVFGQVNIMVATVAFGMGIHKADIRYIVHMDMPRTIEQYYQEIGRAGRDGLPSECLMLYGIQDLMTYNSFLKGIEDLEQRKLVKFKTEKMYSLCNVLTCRRKELLKYFSEHYPSKYCNGCDNCLEINAEEDEDVPPLDLVDETITAQKILSCVYRLDQRFGIKYVIDVLRGSHAKAIIERGHERLSTHGLMKEFTEFDLKNYIHALMKAGFLKQSDGEYPLLQWTERSREITSGKTKVMLKKLPPSPEQPTIGYNRVRSIDDTIKLFVEGRSIEDIMELRKLAKSTILEHLSEKIILGTNLDISRIVSSETQRLIREAIEKVGFDKLTPIKEQLPEEITFGEIRLVSAFYRRKG
jgi:ATP-dependent DNA helicase RecQ